ncbi:MAG: TauD/TfdA family dioxygenase [Burkholderiales bacterium]
MHAIKHRPIEGACAWTGAELRNKTDWIRPFEPAELAEIDAAVRAVQGRGLDWMDVSRDDFPLPTFGAEIAKIAQELETGRGMIMLRGLPQTYTPQELRLAYWGIGAHIGTAVSQGGTGELLGLVEDEGKAVDVTKRRGSKNALELDFHADRSDVVGLLCVRKAKAGGMSRVASATAIHNEILRRRSDLIDVFYADWHNSRQGDERSGEARAYPKPFFGFRDGYFTGLVSPLYIRSAQQFPEVPRLTQQQQEALELYTQLSDELALDMAFEPGDIQLLNNHLTYHSRTSFEDYAEPERKRLLLRLWLSVPGSRPLPQGYELMFGRIGAGEIRGGVACRDGWRDVTQFRARRKASLVN